MSITEEQMNEFKDRYCGYCGRVYFCKWKELTQHTEECEVNCCNEYYGELT